MVTERGNTMKVTLVGVTFEQKSVLRNLMEFYQYDFSEFDQTDVNAHGEFGYKYLDHYWTEPQRVPFFVNVDDQFAGFICVSRHVAYVSPTPNTMVVSEFFIMRKYRRKGVGRAAAMQVFKRFPGPWEVQQTASNLPSQQFWRTIIHEYTHGEYHEVVWNNEHWKGPIQTFQCAT